MSRRPKPPKGPRKGEKKGSSARPSPANAAASSPRESRPSLPQRRLPQSADALGQQILNFLNENPREFLNNKQLRARFRDQLSRELDPVELDRHLADLARAGLLERDGSSYRPNWLGAVLEGQYRWNGRDDVAEVRSPNLPEPIVLLRPRDVPALTGDRVEVQIVRLGRGQFVGELLQVLKPGKTEYVGTLEVGGATNLVHVQDALVRRSFVVPNSLLKGALNGQKVRIGLKGWHGSQARAEVLQVLGHSGEHQVEMHAIIEEFRLEPGFPAQAMAEAEALPDRLPPDEISRRRDFRDVLTFTIDPVDAKDFDDALSLRQLPNGNWEVGVHIADVAFFVRPGTALDDIAREKATSVYLVDRTLPMLPERISNHLCSLVPHQDRAAFAAVFELDAQARVLSEWFGRTVIHSDRRFAYEEVQRILDAGEGEHFQALDTLNRLAFKLREARFNEGSIGFETDEVKFRLDEAGAPTEVYVKERLDAHKLIEDFMLLANRRVAAALAKHPRYALPYRIHPSPDPTKLRDFASFVARFGYRFEGENKTGRDLAAAFNHLSSELAGKPEQSIVQSLAIRSMPKAIYTTHNVGHYGLGFDHYCHFTSPIRRYPDVLTHRALEAFLAQAQPPYTVAVLEPLCDHCSERERVAADAERASVRYKQAEWMGRVVGQHFEGIITGVTEWGLYVTLEGNAIEGMVAMADLNDDYYELDTKAYALVGRRWGIRLSLGDRVRIKVKRTNLVRRHVDFSHLEKLADATAMAQGPEKHR